MIIKKIKNIKKKKKKKLNDINDNLDEDKNNNNNKPTKCLSDYTEKEIMENVLKFKDLSIHNIQKQVKQQLNLSNLSFTMIRGVVNRWTPTMIAKFKSVIYINQKKN